MKNLLSFVFCTILFMSCEMGFKGSSNETQPKPLDGQKFEAATIYSNETRSIWQKPEMVVNLLGDLSDKTVADIGAGTGYFSFRIAFRAKKVIAIDIDEYMIQLMEMMKENLPEKVQESFETRLALPNDPFLKKGEADIVIIVNTIAYISNKVDYLRTLQEGMSDGGKIMIMDFKMKNLPIAAPPVGERVPLIEIEQMLAEAGYTDIRSDDTSLDYQYIVFASKGE